jgi:hypothetical protein
VGAQAAVLPLAVAAFGVFYPSAIVATPLLIPLVALFLWAGLLLLPLAAFAPAFLLRTIAFCMNGLYRWILAVMKPLGRVPGLEGPCAFYGWCCVVVAALGFLLYDWLYHRARGSSPWMVEAWTTA